MLKKPITITLLVTIILGMGLWLYSDAPPYGYPNNEISNYYWGFKVDIARKWRSMEFSLWDRGVAGGTSLFTSGLYPVLSPLNVTAWFLNDEQFYLLHIIFPYLLGFFFTTLGLIEFFGLRFPYAAFGGLVYMGLLLSRGSTITGYPFFEWGAAFFPVLVYTYGKLLNRNFYLRTAAAGGIIALQFASQGVYHFPQIFVWSAFLIGIESLLLSKEKTQVARLKKCFGGWTVLLFFSVGIFAVQFLPTYYYAINESARVAGIYPINSLALYDPSRPQYSVFHYFQKVLIHPGALGVMTVAGFIGILAIFALNFKTIFSKLPGKMFFKLLWLTTIAYIVFPTAAFLLAQIFPMFNKVFSPLTRFTFSYGTYVLDFCAVMTLALMADRLGSRLQGPKYKTTQIVLICVLFSVGTVVYLSGFKRHDKTKRSKTRFAEFMVDSPELKYFRSAKGQYYFPYEGPDAMGFNFGLLYGIESVTAFLNVPPLRLVKFTMEYHPDYALHATPALSGQQKLYYREPSQYIPDYFPVDFTVVPRNQNLGWPGFKKQVLGEEFDIWTRQEKPAEVYFAGSLKTWGFPEVISQFDAPRTNTVFVEKDDAQNAGLMENTGTVDKAAGYSNFLRKRGDHVEFDVHKEKPGYVIVPDMYRKGWEVYANGNALSFFPAYYLFIGFHVPAGDNHILMKYKPPYFDAGVAMSVISILAFAGMIYWDQRRRT